MIIVILIMNHTDHESYLFINARRRRSGSQLIMVMAKIAQQLYAAKELADGVGVGGAQVGSGP